MAAEVMPVLSAMLSLTGEELRQSYNVRATYVDKLWYWGAISRLDSEAMLMKFALPGHHIVRDSETHVS